MTPPKLSFQRHGETMIAHNPENERIKRRYLIYMREARQQGEASLDGIAKALSRFETYTKHVGFRQFHTEQAVAFKRYLAKQLNERTGKPLSEATQHHTLEELRAFFRWLVDQRGFRSRISYTEAEYFRQPRAARLGLPGRATTDRSPASNRLGRLSTPCRQSRMSTS